MSSNSETYRKYFSEGESEKMNFTDFTDTIAWECPSNIALVKYWGKRDVQLPMNPSLSITLSESVTRTRIRYQLQKRSNNTQLKYFFEDKENDKFTQRIATYLDQLKELLPFVNHTDFEIYSRNTFPHSSGIASSASAFGALALCLTELDYKLRGEQIGDSNFFQKASYIARLGSGSASRSIFGQIAVWGAHTSFPEASNEFAIPISHRIHNVFKELRDTILILDKGEKEISSTAGHAMMHNNPYATTRFQQASLNLEMLVRAMEEGNFQRFIDLVEHEALSLHAMMMTSRPGFILLQANSLEVIKRVRQFRAETKCPVCFTIDAGANIHLLYPKNVLNEVTRFIQSNLIELCVERMIISDRIGDGPKQLSADEII